MKRNILFYGSTILEFLEELDDETKDKIEWTIEMIRQLPVIPVKYFKQLEGTKGLYEIRADTAGNAYRLFCSFDQNNQIVLVSGFSKKSQKTPARFIQTALKLKHQYHEENQ